MSRAKRVLEKISASKKSAKYMQSRKDRRPIHVHNLVKKATICRVCSKEKSETDDGVECGCGVKVGSPAGQDLRLPIMGGTKMPTGDGKSLSNKKLRMSSAEVGPMPSAPTNVSLDDLVPKTAGDTMSDPITHDPLIQYLKKQATHDKGLVDSQGMLTTNPEDMPLNKPDHELTSEDASPTPEMEEAGLKSHRGVVANYLDSKGLTKKYTEKTHPSGKAGVVDRILGL